MHAKTHNFLHIHTAPHTHKRSTTRCYNFCVEGHCWLKFQAVLTLYKYKIVHDELARVAKLDPQNKWFWRIFWYHNVVNFIGHFFHAHRIFYIQYSIILNVFLRVLGVFFPAEVQNRARRIRTSRKARPGQQGRSTNGDEVTPNGKATETETKAGICEVFRW